MSVLEALNNRRSVKAANLSFPIPDEDELIDILQSGMSAPDHGAIRPWRFMVFREDDRLLLSEKFAEALQQKEPDCDQEALDLIKSKPLRAPLIVAVWADIMENHPKVPPIEQVVATACATENILLAAEARGYGAILLTGWPAFHPHIQEFLGMQSKDQMIGFIYLGTPEEQPREMKRADVRNFVNYPSSIAREI